MERLRDAIDGPVATIAARHGAALGVYAATFCALYLPRLLAAGPGAMLSNSPADAAIFVWSLGWWPHALAHGTLLPYTHDLFAPGGTNLAWTTSIPVPGLLVAP